MKINKNEELVADKEILESRDCFKTKGYKVFVTKVKEEKDIIHYIQYSHLKWQYKIFVILLLPIQYLIDFGKVIKEDTKDTIVDVNHVDKTHFYRERKSK